MESIEELFEHELKDILEGEQALRLEKIFRSLGQTPEADGCAGIEGLIKAKKLFMREKAIASEFDVAEDTEEPEDTERQPTSSRR